MEEKTKGYSTIILSVIVFALLIFAVSYFVGRYMKAETADVKDPAKETIVATGRLYMSISGKDDFFPEPFVVDFANRTFLQEGVSNTELGIFHSFSRNNKYITFVGVTDEIPPQIYVGNGSGPLLLPSQAVMVSNDDNLLKQNPSVSYDGKKVLYMSPVAKSNSEELTEESVNNNKIYIVADGKTRELVSGSHPKWVDDNSFIYISDNGIELYNTDLSTSTSMLLAMPTSVNMKLDVSDDRSLIAISVPDAMSVFVYKVKSWYEGDPAAYLEEVTTLSIFAHWPQFSPDSKYLAVQAVDSELTETEGKLHFINPRIEVYDLETSEMIDEELVLEDFNQESMFVSDWK